MENRSTSVMLQMAIIESSWMVAPVMGQMHFGNEAQKELFTMRSAVYVGSIGVGYPEARLIRNSRTTWKNSSGFSACNQ